VWHDPAQFLILLEERTREIETAAVRERIPRVTLPNLLLVHREGRVLTVDRNDGLAREVALSPV
jgi:hypothetical protein